MNLKRRPGLLLFALLGLCLALFSQGLAAIVEAKDLAAGDTVPAFSAPDQFGTNYTFAPGPKFLILAFDMDASKAANAKFTALGQGGLDKLGIVYVMDIHPMPAIGRFFALPKMRKYPFRVVLGETAGLLTPFPRQESKLTVLVLAPNGAIRAVHYWNPGAETLEKILE